MRGRYSSRMACSRASDLASPSLPRVRAPSRPDSPDLTSSRAAAVISHHFARHRAIAVGIAFTGSSVGGIVFPIMLNKMLTNPHIGFATTVRWMAGLMAVALFVGNALVRTRLPPRKERPPPVGPQPNIKNFMSEPAFLLAILGYGPLPAARAHY